MNHIEQESPVVGPYSDLFSRNIVLQEMTKKQSYSDDKIYERREMIEANLEKLLQGESSDGTDHSKTLMDLLDKKGKAFQHTREYYEAIEDERERMKAYKSLKVVSTVPYGEDAEIEANPFKFLYLPEDASFAEVRDAWIRLSKKWHPDLIYPENPEQHDRIFGQVEFPIEGKNSSSWLKEIIQAILPPDTLDVEQVEKLSPQEQEEYQRKKQAYREKEIEYEKVKTEMRRRATEKMQILNKAFAAAKKRFSLEQIGSFGGFEWEKEKLYGLNGYLCLEHEVLNLEGNGQLQKHMGRRGHDDRVYLAFDHGDVYLADQHEYRQSLDLRTFFAWTELRQDKGLCPTLLDDLVKTYALGDDQAEQLRIMIINHEKLEFIITALNIPTNNSQHYQLLNFLENVYGGPTYYHVVGPRDSIHYPLGVEFTPDGQLILKYEAQEEQIGFIFGGVDEQEAKFSQTDVQIMRAIAYGPLLQEPKLE